MLELIKNPKFLPTLMIVCNILAAVRYSYANDLRHAIYWLASAVILATITY